MPKKETPLYTHCFNFFVIVGSFGLFLILAPGFIKVVTGTTSLHYFAYAGFMLIGFATISLLLSILIFFIDMAANTDETESEILDEDKR